MSSSYEILRYSIMAAGYLISTLPESDMKRVQNVIIFGSAARLSASIKSDIDIFFDVSSSKRFQLALRAKLNKLAENFYLTNTALEFKSNGIDNELSIKIGKLKDWALEQSISSSGIVVYGKYTSKPAESEAYTILSIEKPGKSKGALLNKLYGYKSGRKRYPGLLEKNKGIKLGKAVIMIPAKNRDIFIEALEKYKVNYSRQDIWK